MKSINTKLLLITTILVYLSLAKCANLEKFRYESVEIKKEIKSEPPKTELKKQAIKLVQKRQNTTINDTASAAPLANNTNNTYVDPIIDNNIKKDDEIKFEPVIYVSSISVAGKAALELANSPDPEYAKLISNGYESPRFINKVYEDKPVSTISPGSVNYLWRSDNSNPLDQHIYQNVEFNRYNNRLLDTTRFNTPAHFTLDSTGSTVVHAPSNAAMHVFTPVQTTISSFGGTFLDFEDNDYLTDLVNENIDDEIIDKKLEDKLKSYYSFLDN